jgi:hypothetical protein
MVGANKTHNSLDKNHITSQTMGDPICILLPWLVIEDGIYAVYITAEAYDAAGIRTTQRILLLWLVMVDGIYTVYITAVACDDAGRRTTQCIFLLWPATMLVDGL